MRVQAVKNGQYNNRRYRTGQCFDLVVRKDRRTRFDKATKRMVLKNPTGQMSIEQQFSDHNQGGWMRPVRRDVVDAPIFNEAKGTLANKNDGPPDLLPDSQVAPVEQLGGQGPAPLIQEAPAQAPQPVTVVPAAVAAPVQAATPGQQVIENPVAAAQTVGAVDPNQSVI